MSAVEPVRVDAALMAIPIQAGTRAVRFEYQPASFQLGGSISMTALALIACVLLWNFARRMLRRERSGRFDRGSLGA